MGSLSDFSENSFLKHILTEAAYSPAATVYLGFCTADPTDAGTGASMNEVANANGYARTAIAFGAAASRRITQNADVVFPTASGSQGTVTHWAIVDSGTYGAGNLLAHGAFNASFAVVSGNTRTVASGEVYIEFSAGSTVGYTTYTANKWLDRQFRNQAFTVSATFISLHITTSSDGTPGTEVTGTDYARVEVNEAGGSTPAWDNVSGGTATNADDVDFVPPGGSWGDVVSMGIYDASTSGNQLAYGNDVIDQAGVDETTTAIGFAAGALDLAVT